MQVSGPRHLEQGAEHVGEGAEEGKEDAMGVFGGAGVRRKALIDRHLAPPGVGRPSGQGQHIYLLAGKNHLWVGDFTFGIKRATPRL